VSNYVWYALLSVLNTWEPVTPLAVTLIEQLTWWMTQQNQQINNLL